VAVLDRIADDPAYGPAGANGERITPREAQCRALAWYEGVREENSSGAAAARERKAVRVSAARYVRGLLTKHPFPTPAAAHRSRDYDDEERLKLQRTWIGDLHAAVLSGPPQAAIAGQVKIELQEQLLTSGFKRSDFAEVVATFILDAPAGTDLDDYLPAEEEEEGRPQRRA
jgi:hypothetical protein